MQIYIKWTSKSVLLALCGGHLPVISEFPAQMACNDVEKSSIWWCHNRYCGFHGVMLLTMDFVWVHLWQSLLPLHWKLVNTIQITIFMDIFRISNYIYMHFEEYSILTSQISNFQVEVDKMLNVFHRIPDGLLEKYQYHCTHFQSFPLRSICVILGTMQRYCRVILIECAHTQSCWFIVPLAFLNCLIVLVLNNSSLMLWIACEQHPLILYSVGKSISTPIEYVHIKLW